MDYLVVIIAAIVGTVWFRLRTKSAAVSSPNASSANTVSDHELAQQQGDFERRLVEEQDLPDSIRGKTAYVYWNLMRNWFSKLSAAHRYDDAKTHKIRQDWCDYIELLPRVSTSRFLSSEAGSTDKASAYAQEADLASRRIDFIQNAFAAAVGPEGIEELRQVRERESDAFDRSGTQPMAPAGHHYFPVSINPYVEKCQPVLHAARDEA